MTDSEILDLLESLGAEPGKDWRLMKFDGKTEIAVSASGFRLLALHAPDSRIRRAALDYLSKYNA
jgi:hypothetical protein